MLLLATLIACPKKAPEVVQVETPAFDRSVVPAPLERGDFALPVADSGTLSNGLTVIVVENHELPLFEIRMVARTGSWTDPVGSEGLAGAAMDMLNEGTEGHDAIELSTALRALGSHVGTGSTTDSARVTASGLSKNLESTLDLWTEVLRQPTFPAEEWDRLEKQNLQAIDASRSDPSSIAGRVFDVVLYGDSYDGRFRTADSVLSLDVAAMEAWYTSHFVPANSIVLVGGDTTLAEITPLLEARLGDWDAGAAIEMPAFETAQPAETTLYVVDKAGAAQSVVYAGRFVADRSDPAWNDLYMGNTAFGGMFTARLNMNLREDKGWTYGARSSIWHGYGASGWMAHSSVVANQTAPAVAEILAELAAVTGDRPLSAEEIAYMKSSRINGYPSRFEGVGATLGSETDTWLYGLPEDFADSYLARMNGVTPEGAQAAFAEHVSTQPLAILVVGDLETCQEPLAALGFPMVELDVEGNTTTKE